MIRMIERRNSLFRAQIRIVQPAIFFNQLRADIVPDQVNAMREPLLHPHIQAFEKRTAEVGILLDNTAALCA